MTEHFHPLIADWFTDRFGQPTEPQILGWPAVRSGGDVLISAPTGSGKTLAAFLTSIDEVVRRAEAGTLGDETLVVYVSPLKALTNDVQRNLEAPLAQIRALADERGIALGPIRTAVRTGDTTQAERAQMLRKPAHILVTTPESLFIFLTAERSRATLRAVRTIVVDEIHAMAGDKRGSHLALTLARLDHLVMSGGAPKPQRIGLSATVKPIEEVAEYLTGPGARATIVDVGHRRPMELSVTVPSDELTHVATNEMWAEIYDRIAGLIESHRTTLVFVGTRRLSERVAFALAQRLGDGVVFPHHGSLSRSLRFLAESRLKEGALRAVVATASLELGIDVGSVDLVVQIGSPRSIAVGLQRIGRSGHWVGATPKGVLFATTRDELIECGALVRAIRSGEMDRLAIPSAPLDILAQQLVAACASDEWRTDDLYAFVRTAQPYRNLPRGDFDQVLAMVSEGVATSRGRSGVFLHHDRVNGRVRARRGARLAAITSGGAIPDRADYAVVVEPEGVQVGTIDEDFAVESMAGDIFLLGQTSWKIRRVEAGKVRVEDAHGAPPSVPFWNGEGLGRTIELSRAVAALRDELGAGDDAEAAYARLGSECGLDRAGAEQAVAYVQAGKAALGVVPTCTTVVAERFFDEGGGMQLILHAPFGARINRAWGLALRKRFCRSFNLELQAAATDNGIVISLSDQHAFPLDAVFSFLHTASVENVLTQALLAAPMFQARWRWNATRSLTILRFNGGRKVPPQIIRMKADDLMAAVFPDQAACPENLTGPIRIPDHVLVRETIDNCLHEAMDIDGLKEVLDGLQRGAITAVAIETPTPSAFSHEILNANPFAYLDDAPLEERRARAVQVRGLLGSAAADGVGILDPAAIEAVADESHPVVRDADELHDALLTLVALPPVAAWWPWYETLCADRRATTVRSGDATFWVCAERLALFAQIHPDGVLDPPIDAVAASFVHPETREAATAELVRGWLESSGPVTGDELAARFALDAATIEAALLQLESEGQVLRGPFRSRDAHEWCNRRVLARIHRRTLGTLRRDIEPVSTADFVRFLYRWQHVAPMYRLHGIEGTLAVIKQLEGFEVPAVGWETQILPRRIASYKPEHLDRLCQSGEVMWGRLSPHPALASVERVAGRRRRVRPTKLVPISLFAREGSETLIARGDVDVAALSHPALDVLGAIERRGAPFFADLARETGRLPAEIEEALWELVAAGLVTADGFDALRSLADSRRRLGEKAYGRRPRASSGRWTLLRADRPTIDVEAFARRLLARYGVVFRDIVVRERIAPPWRELLMVLRRMEAQGEVRGGRFVGGGLVGEQFALPDALEALRAVRRGVSHDDVPALPSIDPLYLSGTILPLQPAAVASAI